MNDALIESLLEAGPRRWTHTELRGCCIWVAESVRPDEVVIYVEPENRLITSIVVPLEILKRHLS